MLNEIAFFESQCRKLLSRSCEASRDRANGRRRDYS